MSMTQERRAYALKRVSRLDHKLTKLLMQQPSEKRNKAIRFTRASLNRWNNMIKEG